MNNSNAGPRVAVVGAGLSGATCARRLTEAGLSVQVFDKSRGPGGRMATRRTPWVDAQGQSRQARFDHGAPGFEARTPAFLEAARHAVGAGWLAQGSPVTPPSELKASTAWRLHAAGGVLADAFDHVVLAMPPLQAAALLAPHRPDWAARAAAVPMQPCWTLMGLTDSPAVASTVAPAMAPAWTWAEPQQGPLGRVMRQDARAGRQGPADEAGWVVHARASWSRDHLEDPPDDVRDALQQALSALLGQPLRWRLAVVHRWRYALPPAAEPGAAAHWWDPALGLGVCGDFLGGLGVEGAWVSGRALAEALIDARLAGPRAASVPGAGRPGA